MADGWTNDLVSPDGDHHEELAPPEVLEALPPRPLTQEELELILGPASEEEQLAGRKAATEAAAKAAAFLDAAVAELDEEVEG